MRTGSIDLAARARHDSLLLNLRFHRRFPWSVGGVARVGRGVGRMGGCAGVCAGEEAGGGGRDADRRLVFRSPG